MESSASQAPTALESAAAHALRIVVRGERGGPVLDNEPVAAADLLDARAEAWWAMGPLRGFPDVSREDLPLSLKPIFTPSEEGGEAHRGPEGPWCAGFSFVGRDPAGKAVAKVFPRRYLEPVAARVANRLLDAGKLEAGQNYYFEVLATPAGPEPPEPAADERGVRAAARPRSAALRYRELPLTPLLARSRVVSAEGEALDPVVIVTEKALERAEALARKGAELEPAQETGGLLVGALCRCPAHGVFTLVDDVLEATDADATTYSLAYSGRTWNRIQAIMAARAADPDPVVAASRILGQFHGHNFLPSTKPPCGECPKRKDCPRSSAFLSSEDLRWCRAVFAGQPWQLSQVFGLDAMGRPVSSFYGQSGGLLTARGYHVIDEADLDEVARTVGR